MPEGCQFTASDKKPQMIENFGPSKVVEELILSSYKAHVCKIERILLEYVQDLLISEGKEVTFEATAAVFTHRVTCVEPQGSLQLERFFYLDFVDIDNRGTLILHDHGLKYTTPHGEIVTQ